MFIQYRIGGGLATNLGVNVINQIGTISFFVNGPSQSVNQNVQQSLQCNNVTAAIGGADRPSLEEIRNYVGFNFSAQKRAVTINDYQSILRTMPSQYGAPAKVAVFEQDNKIVVKLLSYDTNGALTNIVSNTLISNIANYLSNYRMINDYISVQTADVIDLSLDISVVLNSTQSQGAVVSSILNKVTTFFSPTQIEMGETIYISELRRILQSENGVLSVADISVYNKVGGQYSSSETSMSYSDTTTKKIQLNEETLYAEPTQIYQIRFPAKDIVVRTKNLTTVNIS